MNIKETNNDQECVTKEPAQTEVAENAPNKRGRKRKMR